MTPRPLAEVLDKLERQYLIDALRVTGHRRAECARALGISRKALWSKLRRFKVTEAEIKAEPSVAPVAWCLIHGAECDGTRIQGYCRAAGGPVEQDDAHGLSQRIARNHVEICERLAWLEGRVSKVEGAAPGPPLAPITRLDLLLVLDHALSCSKCAIPAEARGACGGEVQMEPALAPIGRWELCAEGGALAAAYQEGRKCSPA